MTALITKLHERRNARLAPRQAVRSTPLVLVVDDHEDTRFMLKTLLGMHGYDAIEVEDGLAAIRAVETARPDVVLMDGSLPHLDGLTATRRIRELAPHASIPIIIFSGHAKPSYCVAALAAGCDDFLVKPIDFAHLSAALEKHTAEKFFGRRETAAMQ